MSQERMNELAYRLRKLGVSETRTVELLSQFAADTIENQLNWLPYRKARRPEAFVIEAIRKGYSPPKEIIHANIQRTHPRSTSTVHPDSEPLP